MSLRLIVDLFHVLYCSGSMCVGVNRLGWCGILMQAEALVLQPYVYWTVHHLDSWIKIDQLDVTCFFISLFNAQHVSNVNTSILRSLRLICWVTSWVVLLWFDVWWCYGVVRLGWCGILMQASVCIRIPTHIEPKQYNTWNKSTINRKLLKMDALTFETCWAVNSEIIKQVTSSWSIFIQLSRRCTVQ